MGVMGSVALPQVPERISGSPGLTPVQRLRGACTAPKAEVPGYRGWDATLLYVKYEHGNNKVGKVLELISEKKFSLGQLKFLAKIHR